MLDLPARLDLGKATSWETENAMECFARTIRLYPIPINKYTLRVQNGTEKDVHTEVNTSEFDEPNEVSRWPMLRTEALT